MKYSFALLVYVFCVIVKSYGQDSTYIKKNSQKWNRLLLTDKSYQYEKNPNTLLIEAIKDVTPGTALDVGMGQGRNAIFLAKQGWQVTGFDIADQAVKQAQLQARQENLKIKTFVQGIESFDFGKNKWDMIALIYLASPFKLEKIYTALKPGGLIVLEHFYTTAIDYAGEGKFNNEVIKNRFLKAGFKIIRYEEVYDKADFGLEKSKLVKIIAQK